jgi:hypothetical protein
MRIEDSFDVRFSGTRGMFPLQRKPFFIYTDFPWQSGVANLQGAEDIVFDFNLQAVYAAPIFIPHHQNPDSGYAGEPDTLPFVYWQNMGGIAPSYRANNPLGFQEIAVSSSTGLDVLDVECTGACQGITFLWARTDPDEGKGNHIEQKFQTFRIGVGVGSDEIIYSIRIEGLNSIRLAILEPGGSWVDRAVLAGSSEMWKAGSLGGESDTEAPLDMNMLECRLIAGRMAFRVGCQDEAHYFEESRCDSLGLPLWQINSARIRARGFKTLACSAHPMKWRTSVTWVSPENPIGFSSDRFDPPFADAAGVVPPGCDIFFDPNQSDLTGPNVYYTAVLTAPYSGTYRQVDYSDWVAAVRGVEVVYHGEESFDPDSGWRVEPEWIEVEHTFRPESLEIESVAKLGFNNNRQGNRPFGYWGTWGQWVVNHGQVGCQIWGSRTINNYGSFGPSVLQFTGYGNTQGDTESSNAASECVITCRGRARQLRNPRWALPWMDGWNVFYAIGFLAQLGGVSLRNMRFAQLIPSFPFGPGSDLGDGLGGPAYYLPVGESGSALTRPTSPELWDLMVKIAASIGFMLFFDVAGDLAFEKFRIPSNIKRTFYESDVEAGGPEGCWAIGSSKDMDEVRSDAILIGVNAFTPRWDPIVMKFTDWGVIDDTRAFNHLGYPNPSAWVDSLFAEQGFAYEAGTAMYRTIRMPGLTVPFTTWYQPDIFPLDVVMVQSDRAGVSGIPLMVVSVKHRGTKELTHSTITARFVPE